MESKIGAFSPGKNSKEMSEKCILVVDDDHTTVLLTKLFLESMAQTDVHSSSNGQEAIDFIYQHHEPTAERSCPELVFLDLNMPVMDGFEFLDLYAKAKEIEKSKISIVVLTSSDSKRDRDRIQQSNVNIAGYLVKPLTEEKIKPFLE